MRIAAGVAAASLVTTVCGVASAEQFVLVDADYTHTKESHAYHAPTGKQPANWKTPIDYANGTAYYRLEVFEKASTENLHMGICFVGGSYCCFGYQQFTKPGVYEWSFPIPSMWQFGTMDWSKNMTDVPLIMRDRNAVKVDSTEAYYGKPNTSLYFPMKSHLTVTIVSKGGTYMKPAIDAGVDAASDAPAPDTGVLLDAGAATDSVASDTSTPVAADAADRDAAAPAEGDSPDVEGACTMGRSSGSPWWFFALSAGAIAWTRRRRG